MLSIHNVKQKTFQKKDEKSEKIVNKYQTLERIDN